MKSACRGRHALQPQLTEGEYHVRRTYHSRSEYHAQGAYHCKHLACIIRPMHLDNFQKGASVPKMHFGTVYCIKSTFFCQYIFSFLLIFSENVMTVIHKIQQIFTKKQAVFDIFLRFCSIQCLCRILGFDCIFMRYSSLSCSFSPRICTSIQARVCSHICV